MDAYSGARYTIEELSRIVGMSARNIRAHQERKLLAPPVRRRRVAYYDDDHLQRLEQIKAMQRQGFNLAAIMALIGDDCRGRLSPALGELARHPELVLALTRHGVVRDDGGELCPVRPELLAKALGMRRFGVPPAVALRFLADILDSAGCDRVGVVTVAERDPRR
ncbi:MAG TPA: MerR family transcriptional regulator [Amycolatopsis sp.]|nr:MerR family transcriptional regulator [Amycolatopsis sp.]